MFRRKQNVKITREFLMILDCFVRNRERWLSGVEIMKNTNLRSGTVYPLTTRMVDGGWLERWEVAEGRRVFRLKGEVFDQAEAMLSGNMHIWKRSS